MEEDICDSITLQELVSINSMCGNEERFKRYAEFLARSVPKKLSSCATKSARSFDEEPDSRLENLVREFNDFFKAALWSKDEQLSHKELYDRVRWMDVAKDQFDIGAMVKVAEEHKEQHKMWRTKKKLTSMLEFFNNRCIQYRDRAMPKTKAVTVALEFKAINEQKLTPKFLLVNEYVHLCIEFLTQKSYEMIKANWLMQLKRNRLHNRLICSNIASVPMFPNKCVRS